MNAVNDILTKFGDRVTKLAKINVGSSRNPNGGKKIDSTGKLRRSIDYKLNENTITFMMEDYGDLRDSGQLGTNNRILKGWNKSIFNRGKGFTNKQPPRKAIDKWIQNKPIRIRDLKTGKFIEATTSRKNSLSFLISRKIKEKGIQPGLFFSDAWNKEYPSLADSINEAFSEDIEELINDE